MDRTEYMKAYKAAQRKTRKAAGVCTECGGELYGRSRTLCRRHLEAQRNATARYKEKKNAVHDRDK